MTDKKVGELWRQLDELTYTKLDPIGKVLVIKSQALIRKLVESEAKAEYYASRNSRQADIVIPWELDTTGGYHFRRFYTRSVLARFNLDPATYPDALE